MEYYVGRTEAERIAGVPLAEGDAVVLGDGGYIRCRRHPLGFLQFTVAHGEQLPTAQDVELHDPSGARP